MSAKRVKVLHVITGLSTGGAETMLYKLLRQLDGHAWPSAVVSLIDKGTLGDRIAALGIPVFELGLAPRKLRLPRLNALRRFLRDQDPDLLQGWMYHGNSAAAFIGKRVLIGVPVIWNIRHSIDALDEERIGTRWLIRRGAHRSAVPLRIIYNARTSAAQHEALGYRRDRTCVIPNGFDLGQFGPSSDARSTLRRELGLPAEALLLGLVGRYHSMKNHVGAIDALARCQSSGREAHLVMAGRGVDRANVALATACGRHGL